jgi:hypothetical protein
MEFEIMKTHTVITLLNGSEFTDIKKALNHCEEMMGAEMRSFVDESVNTQSLYKQMLKIVIDKKYDETFKTYMQWREEHDALIAYIKSEYEE